MLRLTFGKVNSAVIYKRLKGNENSQATKIMNARGVLPLQQGWPLLHILSLLQYYPPRENTPRI